MGSANTPILEFSTISADSIQPCELATKIPEVIEGAEERC
jgi:hypothetical protein